jgi:uncharacterized membrane protein YphA (DoxX/SURF4 family)
MWLSSDGRHRNRLHGLCTILPVTKQLPVALTNQSARMSLRSSLRDEVMKNLLNLDRRITVGLSSLQSPMLLVVRLRWRFQFAQTGWGKLHNLAKITGFFASLNVLAPGFTALAISTLEFVGGILLMFGLFSRHIASLPACNMFVAIGRRTAKRSVLCSPIRASSMSPTPTPSCSPH